MQITISPPKITYDTSDWRLIIDQDESLFIIVNKLNSDFVFNSGSNLESLADLILLAKLDAAEKGINWENN